MKMLGSRRAVKTACVGGQRPAHPRLNKMPDPVTPFYRVHRLTGQSASRTTCRPPKEQLEQTSWHSRQRSDRVRPGGDGGPPRAGAAAGALGDVGRPRAYERGHYAGASGGGSRPGARAGGDRPAGARGGDVRGGGGGRGPRREGGVAERTGRDPRPGCDLGEHDVVAVDRAPGAGERAPGALRGAARVQPGDEDEAGRAGLPDGGERGHSRTRAGSVRGLREDPGGGPGRARLRRQPAACFRICSARFACSKRRAWTRRTSTRA